MRPGYVLAKRGYSDGATVSSSVLVAHADELGELVAAMAGGAGVGAPRVVLAGGVSARITR